MQLIVWGMLLTLDRGGEKLIFIAGELSKSGQI